MDYGQSQSEKMRFRSFTSNRLPTTSLRLGWIWRLTPHGSTPSMRQSLRMSSSQLRRYGLCERHQQLGMLLIQHVSGGPNGSGLVLIVLRMATFAKTLVRAAEPILESRSRMPKRTFHSSIKSPNLARRRTKRGSNLAVAITSYRRLQLLDTYRCTEDGKAGPYWRLEPWQRGC